MPSTEVVWTQFECKYLVVQSVPPFVGNGSHRGSEMVPQGYGSGRATLFASSESFFGKTDRRTQHRTIGLSTVG